MSQFKHGGHIRSFVEESGHMEASLVDFSANINPLGPPDWIRSVVSSNLEYIDRYPDPDCLELRRVLAGKYSRDIREILVGNGSTELIYLAPKAGGKSRAIIPIPSYLDYDLACKAVGLEISYVELSEDNNFLLDPKRLEKLLQGNEIVYLGHPNNPTGAPLPYEDMVELINNRPDTLFIIDEAFVDLSVGLESFSRLKADNLVVLISMTKSFAIPGLRLGTAIAGKGVSKAMMALQQPWSVNNLAQAIGVKAVNDSEYIAKSKQFVDDQRKELEKELSKFPEFKVFPSSVNFILLKILRDDIDSSVLCERTLSNAVPIRNCDNFRGLDSRFVRVAVRTSDENQRLLSALNNAVGRKSPPVKKRKPAIMFQGVSSNAGKSILAAGLCRVLLEDGFKVAPFKAQNMSLNSFVTIEGKEMGRAQVVQAQACGLAPDVRMNPILLKPTGDTGSQVIVMGEPVGNMNVAEYVEFKPKALKKVRDAYNSLAEQFDVMVLEGAGSPAEVNLKSHDIVNMNMAEYANANTLLVGDIDRGGVFASFIGVMETLSQWERKLVAGFVVNRFRGDPSLLDSAYAYTQAHTGKPTLGLIPYINNLGLPEEDSVSFKSRSIDRRSVKDGDQYNGTVEIALIDLPHISNFTDMDCFDVEPDVTVSIVKKPDDLKEPDAVVLPGSKNVIGDLKYLRATGLDKRLHELGSTGRVELVGICGGFQMLGESINDPLAIESTDPLINGLGLLCCSTVMDRHKKLTLTSGIHLESKEKVSGYEIHHGVTDRRELAPALELGQGNYDGARSEDGMVWGAYMHGVFDSDRFRRWFVNKLRKRKGLDEITGVTNTYDLEPAFKRLADIVREGLDMREIYRLAGL